MNRIAAILLCIFLSFNINAAIFTVTNNNDSGAGSLRQAILDASDNDFIVFNLSAGNETIVLLTEIAFAKTLTISGTNTLGSGIPVTVQVTTPGTSTYRVFNLNMAGKIVTLENITLKGGDVSGGPTTGGCIYQWDGTLILDNVVITDSRAWYGGAIYTYNGILTVLNSTFNSNKAEAYGAGGVYGGAIYYLGPNAGRILTITNCTFTSNKTDCDAANISNGGAIYVDSRENVAETTVITNCTFESNEAGLNSTVIGNGGAIFHEDGYLEIYGCTFYNNKCDNLGAALISQTDADGLSITNCTFSENVGTGYDGAIVYRCPATLKFCTIYNNQHNTWGALSSWGGDLTIQNCIIADNHNGAGEYRDYYYNSGTITDNGNNIVRY